MGRDELLSLVRREARPLQGLVDVQAVLQQVSQANTVLLGEASHGTHEFYALRAEITKRLITDHGFDAVAVESDWPDALRVSRYVQGSAELVDADDALGAYLRFPRWMWRNTDVRDFVAWLRTHNDGVEPKCRTGFFGLDLYSLHSSIEAVVAYLDEHDPEAAVRARRRYACFDHFSDDPQRYGHATHFGLTETCEDDVVRQLQDLLIAAGRELRGDADERFYAQQNARVVRNAERYYRTMFAGHNESWNLRDTHMAETLYELRMHLEGRLGRAPRIVVWAHNSHIGDARATEPGDEGQLNLGQLVREREVDPRACALVGFTTHSGTVAAASDWDEPVELKTVRPSRPDSIERLLHDSGVGNFVLPLAGALAEPLRGRLLERALGVIYRPDTERWSHYFHATLSRQFDTVIHLDETSAVTPLDPSGAWQRHEEPETYPSGI